MSTEPEGVFLSPRVEAERLWKGVEEISDRARDDIAALSEMIELGIRAVEILTIECLRRVRFEFPTSVAVLLDPPPPDVDPTRDFVHAPKTLQLVDALDMLSDPVLPCISLGLHRGWVDRAQVCRELRNNTKRATDLSLDVTQRDALMLLGAYRNRIFLLPPPVRIAPDEVLQAFPIVTMLVEQLLARDDASVQ